MSQAGEGSVVNVLTTIDTPAAYDLATEPLTFGADSIDAGSISIAVMVNGAPQTITDDGAGNLSGTGGSLPGGGTVNYGDGTMTGTTAALDSGSDVVATHLDITDIAGAPGDLVTIGGAAAPT